MLETEVTIQLQEHTNVIIDTQKLTPAIIESILLIVACFSNRKKIILFGNGGSAADAQHIAGEFVGVLRRTNPRPPLNAIALTTNTSVLTALVNDNDVEEIFTRQLEAGAEPGDIVIGISTSGNSENVRLAIKRAKELGCRTIGLLGGNGGSIASEVDVAIIVPSQDTPRIQEVHITLGHIICDLVEKRLQENGFI